MLTPRIQLVLPQERTGQVQSFSPSGLGVEEMMTLTNEQLDRVDSMLTVNDFAGVRALLGLK